MRPMRSPRRGRKSEKRAAEVKNVVWVRPTSAEVAPRESSMLFRAGLSMLALSWKAKQAVRSAATRTHNPDGAGAARYGGRGADRFGGGVGGAGGGECHARTSPIRSRASTTRSQNRAWSRATATWVRQSGGGGPEVGDRHAEGVAPGELDVDRRRGGHDRRGRSRRRPRTGRAPAGAGSPARRGRCAPKNSSSSVTNRAGRGAERGDAVDDVRGGEGLVGEVEPDHRDRPALAEHDVRGLRVGDDVELGGGAPVAARRSRRPSARPRRTRSAMRGSLRTASATLVSAAGRHERDRAGLVRHDRLDDDVDGVARVERRASARAAPARRVRCSPWMVVRRLDGRATSGRGQPAANGTPVMPAIVGDDERVAGDVLQRRVAHHRGDREQLDLRVAVGEQQRDGVVVAGVAVEDDLLIGFSLESCRTSRSAGDEPRPLGGDMAALNRRCRFHTVTR